MAPRLYRNPFTPDAPMVHIIDYRELGTGISRRLDGTFRTWTRVVIYSDYSTITETYREERITCSDARPNVSRGVTP
jgi:hypothetical protein